MQCQKEIVTYQDGATQNTIRIDKGLDLHAPGVHVKKRAVELSRTPCTGTLSIRIQVDSGSCCCDSADLSITWQCSEGHDGYTAGLPFYDEDGLQDWVNAHL